MCNFFKKPGHMENTCYHNQASPSFKGSPLVSSVPLGLISGVVNFIGGGAVDYQHDDLIEEIVSGTVLSVQSPADEVNSFSSKKLPYMAVNVYSALMQGVKFSARGCTDSGSSANFCPEALCSKYNVKVESSFGQSYNFKDASGNQICVIWEANLIIQLPGETRHRYLRV